jgi:hypothetical protein
VKLTRWEQIYDYDEEKLRPDVRRRRLSAGLVVVIVVALAIVFLIVSQN